MEWLATAVARCSRGFPFALSGSSRSPRSPSSVSGPGIACPVADVLRRVGVGMSLVPARGAPEHLLLYPTLPVPVLAGVTGDGGIPGVHHDEVRAVLEDPALDFPGEGSESSLRKSLVESVLDVRSGGTRSASSGRGHVPELEALHPDEPAESRHLLGGVPFPVVLDVPELSSKFPSLGMVTLPGPGIARAVLACVLHEPPCLPTSARCIGSVEEIPVARANRVHHAKVDADLSASSRLWHRPSELEVHPAPSTLRTVLIGCAHGAARTRDCQFHACHKALIVRRGYKRAIVATAHKLARTVFAVLRDGQPYRDPEVDYEALVVKRNAPRWLAKLAEFGILEPRDDGTMTVNWANA